MNQEQVIEWAREAGLETHERKGQIRIGTAILMGGDSTEQVMRFAALVAADAAAKERKKHQADIELWKGEAATAEKWRAMALAKDPMHLGKAVQLIQCEAAAYEREACAQAFESWRGGKLLLNSGEMTAQEMLTVRAITKAAAAEIRARGNKEGV